MILETSRNTVSIIYISAPPLGLVMYLMQNLNFFCLSFLPPTSCPSSHLYPLQDRTSHDDQVCATGVFKVSKVGKVQNAMVVGDGTKCKTWFRSPRIIIDVFDDMAIMMIKKTQQNLWLFPLSLFL